VPFQPEPPDRGACRGVGRTPLADARGMSAHTRATRGSTSTSTDPATVSAQWVAPEVNPKKHTLEVRNLGFTMKTPSAGG
jgi:hypothetical protein